MGNEQKDKLLSSDFVIWVLKVLYSPLKAFEEIVNNPTVKGPILILIIMLPLVIGGQYVSGTKLFLEVPSPEKDWWTEKPSNSPTFLWQSTGNITFDNNKSTY